MRDLVDILPIIIAALLLWLTGLSFVFYRLLSHYRKIAGKAKDGDIISAMNNLLASEQQNSEAIKTLKDEVKRLDTEAYEPIQKVGLVRFNPFNETGGDQSFCLCLLNRDGDGFLLTTLHTRDRTRVYTKPVKNGESRYELSKEEQKALKEAQKK